MVKQISNDIRIAEQKFREISGANIRLVWR